MIRKVLLRCLLKKEFSFLFRIQPSKQGLTAYRWFPEDLSLVYRLVCITGGPLRRIANLLSREVMFGGLWAEYEKTGAPLFKVAPLFLRNV